MVHPAGIMVSGLDRVYLGIPLDRPDVPLDQVATQENVHLLVEANIPAAPLWLNEGLAEFFANGRFDLAESFQHPGEATWTSEDHVETVTEPVLGTGLPHEAAEVMRCLRNGETESPLVPLDETLAVMRLMDRIRDQIGVTYAADDFGSSG